MSALVYILKSVTDPQGRTYSPSNTPVRIGDVEAERWSEAGYVELVPVETSGPESIEKKPKKKKDSA